MCESVDIDTTNRCLVGTQGERISVMMPPRAPMSKADALVFAAWIVAQADDGEGLWERTLAAVLDS